MVGSLFATRLRELLTERIPEAAGDVGANSLTPQLVNALDEPLHSVVVGSYNEALIPLFLWMVPLALLSTVLQLFVEKNRWPQHWMIKALLSSHKGPLLV